MSNYEHIYFMQVTKPINFSLHDDEAEFTKFWQRKLSLIDQIKDKLFIPIKKFILRPYYTFIMNRRIRRARRDIKVWNRINDLNK